MATIVFSAVGEALGGPIGSTIGAIIGNQVDRAIIGNGPAREGPRLKELAVTTSSYGTPIARQFGSVRVPGTVIWATDLIESSNREGGGKNRPATVEYSYSVSMAVALSSRPIRRLGRIWADGNLLRGAAGDLKTAGELRVWTGHQDQVPDSIISADKGVQCPAFRGLAYCVFEALELGDFGNRIPALTFEIFADDGDVDLVDLLAPAAPLTVDRALPGLAGYSDEGGALVAHLASLDRLYPVSCDSGPTGLSLFGAGAMGNLPEIGLPVMDEGAEGFGAETGTRHLHDPDPQGIPAGLRYYDRDRDYQPGVQRTARSARTGPNLVLEFPATLSAGTARQLADDAELRAREARDTIAWRTAELDPVIGPGTIVRVPGNSGIWRIEEWELLDKGLELLLRRMPAYASGALAADPGAVLAAPDNVVTPTILQAFELPWTGTGPAYETQSFVAASSLSAGWTGAALFAERAGALDPIGSTGATRAVTGQIITSLPGAQARLLDRTATFEIELDSPDFSLVSASALGIANGFNRALVGGEVLQFALAEALSDTRWRLSGLLRGRGGTEGQAFAGHATGTPFALIDDRLTRLDNSMLGDAGEVAAIGLADAEPVHVSIRQHGLTLKPLVPVHARVDEAADGAWHLSWTRRARGAWTWPDAIEIPLNEQDETYEVGIGPAETPLAMWTLAGPELELASVQVSDLRARFAGHPLWVRQRGSYATSDPLLLTNL